MKILPSTVGIVGYGHLGQEMARTLSRSIPRVLVSRRRAPDLRLPEGAVWADNSQIFRESQVVLLTVKPRDFPAVVEGMDAQRSTGMVVSMMAGVTEATLELGFPAATVIRAMTSLAFGKRAALSALSQDGSRYDGDQDRAGALLSTGGATVRLPSSTMNAFTTVCACGIGWIDALRSEGRTIGDVMKAMEVGIQGLMPGTPHSDLFRRALEGSYQALTEDRRPGNLFCRVATPGGMTASGWDALSSALVRGATLGDAVQEGFHAAKSLADAVDLAVRTELTRHL